MASTTYDEDDDISLSKNDSVVSFYELPDDWDWDDDLHSSGG